MAVKQLYEFDHCSAANLNKLQAYERVMFVSLDVTVFKRWDSVLYNTTQ
jgi:hypothetical protein